MAWANAESEVRSFIEKTQVPFLRSPVGKGVIPDDHPLSVGAARTLALQNAHVVFLMGARFNWIFHFSQPPRYAKDMKVIQLDIAPEEIGHKKATEAALVGDSKAIPPTRGPERPTRWPPVVPSEGHHVAPDDYQEAGRERGDDPAADPRRRGASQLLPGLSRRRLPQAEGAATMDIGLTQLPSSHAPFLPERRHLRHDGGRSRPSHRCLSRALRQASFNRNQVFSGSVRRRYAKCGSVRW
jgi:2-hydroxyacyl-CoA lyase 1